LTSLRMGLMKMELELVCENCGRKRFMRRSTSISFRDSYRSTTYECISCHEWIEVIYNFNLRLILKGVKN
jgi:DNA-directed RNA polymerase subunit RPC12/RpoP